MNSKDYWNERAEQRLLTGEKTADELLQTMKPVYKNSLADIDKEIQAFYGRYAENNELSLVDVNKRLNPIELKSAKDEIKRYYESINKLTRKDSVVSVDLLHQYKDELRLQSVKAYMSRLEELKLSLKNITVNLGVKENEAYYQALSRIYSDNYSKTSFDIDKFCGFSSGFEALNYKKLNRAVHQKWLGMNYSDRIWNNKGKLLDQLNTTFLQGVAQGYDPRKIAKKMAENYGTAYHNCERLCRTECAHIMGEATKQGYKDHNVEQYKFEATLDGRTSEICQSLDGEVFNVKDAEAGVNYPPLHPNCRSTTIPYFEPDEIDTMFDEAQRIAKDENGELYYVPESMNYKQWQETMQKKPEISTGEVIQKVTEDTYAERIDELQKQYDDYLNEFRATDDEQLKEEIKTKALKIHDEKQKVESELSNFRLELQLKNLTESKIFEKLNGLTLEDKINEMNKDISTVSVVGVNKYSNLTEQKQYIDKEVARIRKIYMKNFNVDKLYPLDKYYVDSKGDVFKFGELNAYSSKGNTLFKVDEYNPADVIMQPRIYITGVKHSDMEKLNFKFEPIAENDVIGKLRKGETLGGISKSDERFIRTYTHATPHNSYLRKGGDIDEMPDARRMKDIIDRTNSYSGTYYRGVVGDYAEKLRKLKVGDTFTDKGFVSTSSDKDVAERFAGDKGVIVKIISKGGKSISFDVGSISEFSDENETIFNAGLKMKVKSVKKDEIVLEI